MSSIVSLEHSAGPDADRHADLHLPWFTVLTFLFTMTQVPLESVAAEAFFGHREV